MSDAVELLTAALADRYKIQEELGAGGMATVYLAKDLKQHGIGISIGPPKVELGEWTVQGT